MRLHPWLLVELVCGLRLTEDFCSGRVASGSAGNAPKSGTVGEEFADSGEVGARAYDDESKPGFQSEPFLDYGACSREFVS